MYSRIFHFRLSRFCAVSVSLIFCFVLFWSLTANAVTIRDYGITDPLWITAGPDGNLWFTEQTGNKIGQITPAGVITEFPLPTPNSYPAGITAGPDGNLWFTEPGTAKIGQITPAGVITEFPAGSQPISITAGPDGNLWFTDQSYNMIGRITTAGVVINEYTIPTANSHPKGITAGSDGNLWFTESDGNKIGQITTAGVITEFGGLTANSGPVDITAGPDGNLWFTEEQVLKIGRITTAGVVTEFPLPTPNSYPAGITAGPDGNLWFTEPHVSGIGRITTAGVVINEYTIPTAGGYPWGITAGPDGNLWLTESEGNKIGQITTAGVITDYTIISCEPTEITAGSDGNLWFTESDGNNIGQITPLGFIIKYPIPTATSHPVGITAGPDGNLWFTEADGNNIGRITTAGVITEFPIPTAGGYPIGIRAGPDGNLWFTEADGNKIGRITTSGVITEYTIPTGSSFPYGITAGPDGNLWFNEDAGNKIGRITTAGVITEFPIPTGSSGLADITAGPDGNLWFTEHDGNKIGRITTAGVITEFPIPTVFSGPGGITAGPDGNLWFTEAVSNKIGRITTAGVITEFAIPTAVSYPNGITAGPDGNLWFTEYLGNKIGQVTSFGTSPPPPPTLISPFDGETNVALTPTFTWNVSAGSDSYGLQVATDINFTSLVVDQEGITTTSYTPASPLSIDATYYWQVSATNTNGTSWSEVWSFHTQQIYGNLFIGVRGKLDPDTDGDGIDDTNTINGEGVLGTTVGKKTLFIRPKQQTGIDQYVYWEDFYNKLFTNHPKPGFVKIDPLWNAGIEVVVIGATGHTYSPFDNFNYDPSTDPNHPPCDILDVVNKLPDSYYGSSPYKGHTFFKEVVISENPLVVKPYWWWDTKGYTPNNPNTPQYQTYGYFTPELYSFPLEKYFKEGAYTSISQGISPYTTNCYNANPPCDISSFSSPVNLPPDVDTVEFNPITFNINNGQITEMDTAHIPAKGYTREDVLRRTTIHEIGHALLNASNDDHCENPQCIMYEAVTDWELHDFGSYDVSGAPKCFHVSGGAKDIRQRIHNTQHLPAPPPPPPLNPVIGSIVPYIPPLPEQTDPKVQTKEVRLCTITINGTIDSHFGSAPGKVKFWNPAHTAGKAVTPLSWSDTQIKVKVPAFGTPSTFKPKGKIKDVQVIPQGTGGSNFYRIAVINGICP